MGETGGGGVEGRGGDGEASLVLNTAAFPRLKNFNSKIDPPSLLSSLSGVVRKDRLLKYGLSATHGLELTTPGEGGEGGRASSPVCPSDTTQPPLDQMGSYRGMMSRPPMPSPP